MDKKTVITALFVILLALLTTKPSQSQTIQLLGGNTLNGAMNGVALGGATMALQNSNDYSPARVGLGAGTLFGIAIGVYDVSSISSGQQFYISGTFNDGTNTSILILLDTFYGAAGGAIVASSISLIAQKPIVEALQYGSGVGAWAGFGFGLIDAFVLSSRPGDTVAKNTRQTDGFINYSNQEGDVEIGFFSPGLTEIKTISPTAVKSNLNPTIDILQLNIRL